MKGGIVTLLHNLLLKQDKYYSKSIKGMDETMIKKMHNFFMSRCAQRLHVWGRVWMTSCTTYYRGTWILSSMIPLLSPKRNPKFKCALFLLIPTFSDEGRDTCMNLENFYVTPCFSHDYQLTLVEYIKQQNTQRVCTTRERETERHTFFWKKNLEKKNDHPPKNKIKKMPC